MAGVVKTFSALVAGLFALPVWSFVRNSIASNGPSSVYPIGSLQNLQEEVSRVAFTRIVRDGWMVRTAQDYVWVRKKPDGSVIVFEPHCTHLGCAFNWDINAQQFLCPCHGGKFDKDGQRIAGPPPRPLDRYEVKVINGQIRIGKLLKA